MAVIYLVPTKTAVVEALRSVFDSHLNPDFQNINRPLVDIEYPMDQSYYPGVWVQYADTAELTRAGIDHTEATVDTTAHTVSEQSRWRFSGTVTLTVVALSSYERDRLYDEVIRVFVSARFNPALQSFRDKIENNPFVAINANFDDLQPFGDQAAPGTPWGTNEVVYEKSVSFDVIGEFRTDARVSTLVPLSSVTYLDYEDGSLTPAWPDDPDSTTATPTPGDWDRTSWT